MKKTSILFTLAWIIVTDVFLSAQENATPKWASDQLKLRSIVQQSIRETQKWQRKDGTIFPFLDVYKWDDEVEIFYYWMPYYLLTGDESVYNSIKGSALAYIQRAVKENLFDHGYYKDAFFDTEHTLEGMITLANLAWIRPDDDAVVSALEDVVEHAGNFVSGYEPWFEPTTSLMRTVSPGTKKVRRNNSASIDWAFNLQFVKMALATYYSTGNTRYLEWSKTYLDGWIRVLERNKKENGFYVLPAEVDPYSGAIGFLSGAWYYSAFQPGWGWQENGNSTNRDMRGAFLDTYRLTGERRFLEAQIKHVQTLFDNGTADQPANNFDGHNWKPGDNQSTVDMSVQASLLDNQMAPEFNNFMKRWYEYQRYPDPEFHYWAYRKFGGENKIELINAYALDNARKRLVELKEMTALPEQPDLFIRIGGYWGLTMPPFGGLASPRGEMPWLEVMYYKQDQSLGLPDGVATLFESSDESGKTLQICNTTDKSQTVWIQNGFPAGPIYRALVDGAADMFIEKNRVRVQVAAGRTISVRIETIFHDFEPPLPPSEPMVSVKIN
jgi:hypothetical protein